MSKKFLIVLAIIIIAGVAVFVSNNKTEAPSGETSQTQNEPASETGLLPQENVVIYTGAGYSPGSIKIKTGETVVFKNESSQPMWTASAMHPTHMLYPGSDIKKCGTGEASKIFDSCAGAPAGESWSFKFDNAGEWKYHNHLNASHYGAITVE